METPIGKTVVDRMVPEMHLSICGCDFFTQSFVLKMRTFDLILGMDWLTMYQTRVDCIQRMVSLVHPSHGPIVFQGSRIDTPIPVISTLEAVRLLQEGADAYLMIVIPEGKVIKRIEDIPVV